MALSLSLSKFTKSTCPSTVTRYLIHKRYLVRLLLLRGLLRRAIAQRQCKRYVDDGADDSDCFDPTGREQRRTHDRTDDARAGKQSVLKAQ